MTDYARYSTVFRTMLEDFPTTSDGSDAIGLSDVEIESSAVVKASLDLLYGLPCPDLRLNSSGDTVRNMLKFLHKYECSTLLDHLRLHIRQSAHEGVQMRFTLLEAAIVIDDPKLCRNIILGIADRTWNAAFMPPNADSNAQRSDSWIPGGHVLDVSAMSEPTRRRIPERYLTALLRAYRLANGKRTDWAMVADEFYWQVTGRRESRDAMCRMELRNSGGRAK